MGKHLFRAVVLASAALAITPAAHAAAPPRIVKTSSLSATRIDRGSQDYYAIGAVVRFDRDLTSSEQQRYGLITTQWTFRDHLNVGRRVPDALFGGISLGRIGTKGRHCYVAEVATFRAWHTVKPGGSWRLALHDGHTVLRDAPRTILLKATNGTERQQAAALGC
jgi:hypothetical protein